MKIIYETKNFNVFVPDVPHISREEGGHLCISSKRDNCLSRLDLSIDEAIEFIRLSMLVGDAMTIGMKNGGVDVIMINYQENGNWAYLRNEKPFFHLHLYGRTMSSKHQKFGEALYFPDPNSTYYNNTIPLNDHDINEILKEIKNLENNEKYKLDNWRLVSYEN